MTAALLREAADRLDALAGAATPGKWGVVGPGLNLLNPSPASSRAHIGCESSPDAAYIAAMSPTVGKALAEWLRDIADSHDETACPVVDGATAVAHAVLRRAA